MIEERIAFIKEFKRLSDKLREITDEIENFLEKRQEELDKEIAKDPKMVLKLMKKGDTQKKIGVYSRKQRARFAHRRPLTRCAAQPRKVKNSFQRTRRFYKTLP